MNRRADPPSRKHVPHVAAWLLGCIILASSPARADEYADVQRLAGAGRTAEALALIDQTLRERPRDPQMLFLRAGILAGTGHADEAMAIYGNLIQEYPELPEPYNNLAVLHAKRSEFERARALLEQAVRARPDYAAAHENLGDVYARLAAGSWQRAAQLDPARTTAAPKLALVRQWLDAAAQATPAPDTPPAQAPATTRRR